ncbi:MAG: hypothetical protein ACJ8KX_07175 [Chthoniobacterales bacterium]
MSKRYLSKVNAIVRLVVLAIGLTLVSQPICSFASGGTGGGGEGTGGGGGGTTANPNAITSFKVLAGYPPGFLTATAIWTSFSVKTANNAPPYVRLIIINTATGETVWDYIYQSAGATIETTTSLLTQLTRFKSI